MLTTFLWTLVGVPVGYVTFTIASSCWYFYTGYYIPQQYKHVVIPVIVFFAFLRGYTGFDLVTNICDTI